MVNRSSSSSEVRKKMVMHATDSDKQVMQVMRVRRWLSKDRQIVYVFVGSNLPPKIASILRQAEEGEPLPPPAREVLSRHFGPDNMQLLSLHTHKDNSKQTNKNKNKKQKQKRHLCPLRL